MILVVISGAMFLTGGYIWIKVLNAFRSREAQNRALIEAEIIGIAIGAAFVLIGVLLLVLGLKSMSSPTI